ncbi:hypothetical protein CkaCkLH20_10066 [Colletotrichum karsti]|uniref:Uncharacterized protein n=1 Tax=Colletotrichum karsti TaxID=1095194 RepID=A0A9P6HXV7_9PEZI|nr:uncharacterized protein CkaCkLH20_10066 [Colletotrichum karsti]KAF9872569.1 hypothetical protein CkaCkLH20_10066 [Colletotrichum karsti]
MLSGAHMIAFRPFRINKSHREDFPERPTQPIPSRRSRKSKASSHRRRRSPDSSLLAVGSWSNQSHRDDGNQARTGRFDMFAPVNDEIAAKSLPMDSASGMMDDFVLFPDDTAEDALVPYEEALPPCAPCISRLRTPDLAPMSTDVQFFPCLGDEREEDRINEAWYLAGREKMDSQLNDALAYMAGTEGRRRRLGN